MEWDIRGESEIQKHNKEGSYKWGTQERIIGVGLLHPKLIPRLAKLGDRTMGCRTLVSPVIRSVRHHDYSIYPSVPEFHSPLRFMFPIFVLFHVYVLIRIFVLFYFRFPSPNPDPDTCPILITLICSLWYLYVLILMYVPQSV